MAKLTLFTQAAKDSTNEAVSPENLVNCYVEQNPGDAEAVLTARSIPGEESFSDVASGPVRAIRRVGDFIFVVANQAIYRVTQAGNVTNIGSISDSVNTSISGNTGSYVTFAAGGNYYVWDGASLTQPGGGRFTGGAAVAQVDFDTLIVQPDGREVEWTDNADPTSRDAVNFRTKESRPDNVLRVVPFLNQVYIFGEESTEVWYNTGASGAQRYQRLAGGVIDEGLLAYNLVVEFDSGIFLIGNDKVAKVVSGTGFMPVSTPPVQSDIENSTPIRVDYFEDRGHKFCVVVFSDRPAWIYDNKTRLWFRRSTGVTLGAWSIRGIAEAWGGFYTVTNDGEIHRLARSNTDVSVPLKRRVVSKPLTMEGAKFSVSKLQFLGRIGRSDIGRDAQVMLRVSWDGGNSWSQPEMASLGDLGDYDVQAEFRALGRGERFAAEFSITDAADIQFYSDAYVELR